LLCISKEVFKELGAALREFGIRPSRKITSCEKSTSLPKFDEYRQNKKNPAKERTLRDPTVKDLASRRDRCTPAYEPTNIIHTRDSSLWRWQRMRAWFKEQELYEDGDWQYREITLENKECNEKRHIY